jgi:Starch-binding associating with outer membrane
MKISKISKYVVFAAILGTTTTSCDSFLDVNKNPNSPVVVPPSTLLPSAVYGMAFANNNEINRATSVLVNHLAGMAGNPAAYDTYNLVGSFDNQWNGELYSGTLVAAQRMIDRAEELKSPAYSGVGKIIKAYTFSMITDLWGDVPYSQALQGNTGIYAPRADKQEDIYKGNATLKIQSLFDLVKEGLADLDKPSAGMPAGDDPIYAGDLSLWKRAGNTLMMKMALQISSKDAAFATPILQQVITGNNYLNSNTQDFDVSFGSATGSVSPSFNYTSVSYGNLFRNDMCMSKRSNDVMSATNDPRLPLFFTKPGARYVFSENGLSNAPNPNSAWSRYGVAITGGDGKGPIPLLTNSQRAFMMAEIAVRFKIGGDAQTLFQDGIRASMAAAGVTPTAITAYFTANPTAVTLSGSDAAQIEQIINQKWISLVGNSFEAYNDWRRTGFPQLVEIGTGTSIDGKRPRRFIYTNNEISRNPNLLPAGTTVPPQVNVRVWWDIN